MIDTYAHTEQQQEKIEISGIVLDQSKEPLVGVNVSVKDLPGLGAITDINGKFKINT
ncbi:carboxypeptidase-like regulatory domain-containing protein [Bacteroides faecis]|nr:carboxypeptidase-like regulatory domain-containing protein [Bacteroides faecis]